MTTFARQLGLVVVLLTAAWGSLPVKLHFVGVAPDCGDAQACCCDPSPSMSCCDVDSGPRLTESCGCGERGGDRVVDVRGIDFEGPQRIAHEAPPRSFPTLITAAAPLVSRAPEPEIEPPRSLA